MQAFGCRRRRGRAKRGGGSGHHGSRTRIAPARGNIVVGDAGNDRPGRRRRDHGTRGRAHEPARCAEACSTEQGSPGHRRHFDVVAGRRSSHVLPAAGDAGLDSKEGRRYAVDRYSHRYRSVHPTGIAAGAADTRRQERGGAGVVEEIPRLHAAAIQGQSPRLRRASVARPVQGPRPRRDATDAWSESHGGHRQPGEMDKGLESVFRDPECVVDREFPELDGWVRRRLRSKILRQWRHGTVMYHQLRARRIKTHWCTLIAHHARSYWHNSHSSAMHKAFPNRFFDTRGLPRLST